MEANVEAQSAAKSPEQWQIRSEKLKKIGCNYSRLQKNREGFLVFLNANEVSCLTTNETIRDLSINGLSVVVLQKIVSRKTVIIWNVDKILFQKNMMNLCLK